MLSHRSRFLAKDSGWEEPPEWRWSLVLIGSLRAFPSAVSSIRVADGQENKTDLVSHLRLS